MRSLLLILFATALFGAETAKDRYAASYAAEALGEYQKAIDAIEPMLSQATDDYLLNLRLGWLRYCLGNYVGAQVAYGAAIRRASTAIEPRLGLILPLVALGNWMEVEKQARAALRLDANNATANRWLAESLLYAGRFLEASEIAERLADQWPGDANIAWLQARSRTAKGDMSGAKSAWERLQLLNPASPAAAEALANRTTP